jgi:hypothetical protein
MHRATTLHLHNRCQFKAVIDLLIPLFGVLCNLYLLVLTLLGLVYFSGIFTSKRCGDGRGFSVHLILSNPLKYSFQKYSTMIKSF